MAELAEKVDKILLSINRNCYLFLFYVHVLLHHSNFEAKKLFILKWLTAKHSQWINTAFFSNTVYKWKMLNLLDRYVVYYYLYFIYLYSASSVYRPPFYHQNSRLSRFPPLKIPRYNAKLSYHTKVVKPI